MPEKFDPDSSPGVKLLRAFRKLLLNDRKHYQSDLAKELNCSSQTIIRIMADIERVIGANLQSGTDGRRKWHRIVSSNPLALGLKSDGLRFLSICRDLAVPALPHEAIDKVDDAILQLSMGLSEKNREALRGKSRVRFFNKGRINYRGLYPILEKMIAAAGSGQVCRVLYKALGKKEPREHFFAPREAVSLNQALYFTGAILKRDLKEVDCMSTLALHRIKELSLMDRHVALDFESLDASAFGMPWHAPMACSAHFRPGKAAEYVAERIWSDPQSLDWQPDGSLILGLVVNSAPEFQAWIRSFGDEVLECEENSEAYAWLLDDDEEWP